MSRSRNSSDVISKGQGDMPPRECRIDAITAASKPDNLDEKVGAILAKLRVNSGHN